MIKVKQSLKGKLNVGIKKVYPELEDLEITPTTEEQTFSHPDSYGYNEVKVNAIKLQEKTVDPTNEKQDITADKKYDGLSKVSINAIKSETLNVNPTEQEQRFNGIYSNVNVGKINTEEKTLNLDFNNKDTLEFEPSTGKYIKKATINKDDNLVAENIKAGVSIFGISGNNADTSDADATSNDIRMNKTAYVNNMKIVGTMEVSNHNAKTVDEITSASFTIANLIEEIDFSNIIRPKNVRDFRRAFYKATNLKKVIGLETKNVHDMDEMFYGCSSLITISEFDTSGLSSLTDTFTGCNNLSDESLNNILKMCTNAIWITTLYYKSLKIVGLSQEQAERCKALPNYQAFLDAGWTTGY